jgi:hypothetical protein
MLLLALSEAWKTDIALIAVFGVAFPALVQGMIMFAVAVAKGEGVEDRENRRYPEV